MAGAVASTTALGLVRGWAVDWLNSHDPDACADLLSPAYRLTIGAVVLEGREQYVAATVGQLELFPGLCLTVHDVVISGELVAARFTEHGAAPERGGACAAWAGIAVFRTRGGMLEESWAEEDYVTRSAQLRGGLEASVETPHVAPWDEPDLPGDEGAEAAVRAWLAAPRGAGVVRDDGSTGVGDAPAIGPIESEVLFSAGRAVAFHGRAMTEGIPMGVAGILRVDASGAVSGHVVSDRSGLRSALRKRGA